jgi:hypothetical protein
MKQTRRNRLRNYGLTLLKASERKVNSFPWMFGERWSAARAGVAKRISDRIHYIQTHTLEERQKANATRRSNWLAGAAKRKDKKEQKRAHYLTGKIT